MGRPVSEGGPYKRKEHRQEWLGHKSVVFAGEFCRGERRHDEAMDEFRANFD
jgi:hypothetical protein